MNMTARELSESLNISYPVAAGLCTLLEESGEIETVGKKTHWTGKGKKTKVYNFPNNININFKKLMRETKHIPNM
jgi:hypothetical protein